MTASQSGQRLARLTIWSIESMRDDTNASNFYHYAVKRASQHEMIAEPTTEKKHRRPNYSILQYVDGCPASGSAVLLTAANSDIICEEGIQFMQDNYFDDVNVYSLRVELLAFKEICKDEQIDCFADVLCLLKSKEVERALLSNVQIVVELLLINPATSATPERSFSLSRCLKTWQCSTMMQKRFNSLAILHEHEELTDNIHLMQVRQYHIERAVIL